MVTLGNLISDLAKLQDPQKAQILSRFFKTGKGQYGEGDIFLGVTVPQLREVAKNYTNLSLTDIGKLLKNKIHEHRFTALLLLVAKFQSASELGKKQIFDFYLKNTKHINNWDLVDSSADFIIGAYLQNRDKSPIYRLAKSQNLWERRIAVISTWAFIRKNQFRDNLKIAKILLSDKNDLIHKAVGWMLREVGKRDQQVEEVFLKKYYRQMPRTMLRYAIEKFDKNKRKFYMSRN